MLLLFFLSFFKSLFFNFTLNVQSYKRAIGEVSINVSSVLVMLLHDLVFAFTVSVCTEFKACPTLPAFIT